ncbi:phosphoribosyl-AMP cyclohydrolase [Pigmentiphaga humi]|uniref:Phosphoribosyl-AMP cyclohydrolase n=1 Tax=Pigmentiphaga humi TaxID=2478468 RepID=A0A3P4BAQ3_9BURK|nr:phosphoribosyl-AMP cyclohydrolase [Pigmentiphaga humi]VCU72626.1 phosphoribosyl-AMP cyclohydrolase [Pigmentiphaga humi]
MSTTADSLSAEQDAWLDEIVYDEHGLVPGIAQDVTTEKVVMFAFLNRESLRETLRTGNATYWSRSRGRLWRKGEESGHVQRVRELRLDCDGDVLLLRIEQVGGIACHTGRERCFYRRLDTEGGQPRWVETDPVLKDPGQIYTPAR